MKKWLSPLLFASCLFGAGVGMAAAGNCNSGMNAKSAAITNVDAITTVPLHVRSGPGKHYKAIDVLPPDFPLVVGSCTRKWCQVYYPGRNGWSALPYLAFKKGGKHYKNPQLGPFADSGLGGRRGHRVAYSVNGGKGHISGRSGWWTNYHRPKYQRAWQPRWWQKKR